MSQLLHERQLLTQLFHLSSHCELRVSRLHTPVAPEEHWHTSTRPTALHRDSFTTVTRYRSLKKILFNSRICACTTTTVKGFFFFFLMLFLSSIPGRFRGGATWNLRWAEWRNDENLYSLATGLFERGASERTRAGKWQHHFMMLKWAWRPRLLTF